MSKKIVKLGDEEIDNEDIEQIPKFKIIILGNTMIGKTSLILRYCKGKFDECGISTVGVDTQLKYIKYDDKIIGLDIWDTAGQERYKSLAKNTFQGADGIILMYDLTDKKTFEDIRNWHRNIRDSVDIKTIAIILVGNKSDLNDRIVVKKEVVEKYCTTEKLQSIETSCKDNVNVDETFEYLIEKIMKENSYKAQYGRTSKLTSYRPPKKKKCCK